MISPHRESSRRNGATQLAVLLADGSQKTTRLSQLTGLLKPDDVVVLNVAATLPSSFKGKNSRTGQRVELRLAAFAGKDHRVLDRWQAVVLAAGNWRTPTEWRTPANDLREGDLIRLDAEKGEHEPAGSGGLKDGSGFVIEEVDSASPQWVRVQFASNQPLKTYYQFGRPIQYSYMKWDLEVFDQQNIFSQFPISVEPPSAGLQLNWSLLAEIQKLGCKIVPLIHGAGISSTGDPALDARLPLPEYSFLPVDSAFEISAAIKRGSRVIAIGTIVFRALESAWHAERRELRTGQYPSTLKIDARYQPKVVAGLLTGIHDVDSHHGSLVQSLQTATRLRELYEEAERQFFSGHEFGDLALVFKADPFIGERR